MPVSSCCQDSQQTQAPLPKDSCFENLVDVGIVVGLVLSALGPLLYYYGGIGNQAMMIGLAAGGGGLTLVLFAIKMCSSPKETAPSLVQSSGDGVKPPPVNTNTLEAPDSAQNSPVPQAAGTKQRALSASDLRTKVPDVPPSSPTAVSPAAPFTPAKKPAAIHTQPPPVTPLPTLKTSSPAESYSPAKPGAVSPQAKPFNESGFYNLVNTGTLGALKEYMAEQAISLEQLRALNRDNVLLNCVVKATKEAGRKTSYMLEWVGPVGDEPICDFVALVFVEGVDEALGATLEHYYTPVKAVKPVTDLLGQTNIVRKDKALKEERLNALLKAVVSVQNPLESIETTQKASVQQVRMLFSNRITDEDQVAMATFLLEHAVTATKDAAAKTEFLLGICGPTIGANPLNKALEKAVKEGKEAAVIEKFFPYIRASKKVGGELMKLVSARETAAGSKDKTLIAALRSKISPMLL